MSRKSLLIFTSRLLYFSASLNLVIHHGTLRGLRAVLSSAFGEEQHDGPAKGLFFAHSCDLRLRFLQNFALKSSDAYSLQHALVTCGFWVFACC